MAGPSIAARFFDAEPFDLTPAANLSIPSGRSYIRLTTGASNTTVTSILSPRSGDTLILTANGSGSVMFTHTAPGSAADGKVSLASGGSVRLQAGDFLVIRQDLSTGHWYEVSRSLNSESASGSVPAAVASSVTAEEFANGGVRHLRLTLDALELTVTNVTGASFGGVKVYDFDDGYLKILGARCALSNYAIVTAGSAGFALTGGGDFSLGSAVTTSATLNSTFANVLGSTSVDPLSGGAAGVNTTSAALDGTGTAIDLYLNHAIDDADVDNLATDVFTVDGQIDVFYLNLGDA